MARLETPGEVNRQIKAAGWIQGPPMILIRTLDEWFEYFGAAPRWLEPSDLIELERLPVHHPPRGYAVKMLPTGNDPELQDS